MVDVKSGEAIAASQFFSAKVIADSISDIDEKRITTLELVYPRFIHSELMTHRVFSRNAMSSRAIPIEKMIQQVQENPAAPIHWGKNQSGMQASEELYSTASAKHLWVKASRLAAGVAALMDKVGLHKQVVNRVLEPYQWMKTVVTSTEFRNFFWLRYHPDAQPEIKYLAELMLTAVNSSQPARLEEGEWHTPYYGEGFWSSKECEGFLEDALAISASCCAQVSYRQLDDSLEKAKRVYERLVASEPVHASPFEHQATPIPPLSAASFPETWAEGVTHCDRKRNLWSGNFMGWIQHRQLIPKHVKM